MNQPNLTNYHHYSVTFVIKRTIFQRLYFYLLYFLKNKKDSLNLITFETSISVFKT